MGGRIQRSPATERAARRLGQGGVQGCLSRTPTMQHGDSEKKGDAWSGILPVANNIYSLATRKTFCRDWNHTYKGLE